MVDRDLFVKVGGFSGAFVRGDYEDSDFCLRLIEAGCENWYFADVELYHLEGQSYESSLRRTASRYNGWLQTHIWGDRIAEVMDVVDGWEYDPYFVEVARLVNAYNGTTRVSFFERDITDARIYHEHYDVVLAFSVFEYLRDIVETLAAITDGAIVLETHRLEGNLESVYLNPIGRFFPHHFILGGSDWGSGKSADGERAVIVFARTHAELRAHL